MYCVGDLVVGGDVGFCVVFLDGFVFVVCVGLVFGCVGVGDVELCVFY